MTDSTRETIVRCQQGDLTAFDELVRSHQAYAFGLALRLLHNEIEAEDVTQEAFVKAWRHIDRFDPNRKFTTWLYKIVVNLCLDMIRARKNARRLFSPIETIPTNLEPTDRNDPMESQSNWELCQLIRDITADLAVTQRLVFTLRDLENLSIQEVCEITGLSVASVKTNLHYARKNIRAVLATRYDVRERLP
ncbi:MAG: RNA polymerase sigma factor [Ignavibacteria bacterium]|nr:RNA polymerase sigma factor [Ignavibacteria bacterium]